MQHTRQRLGQGGREGLDWPRIAINLITLDQSVLGEAAWTPRAARLALGGVLVVADVVVAAAACPALAAAAQAGDGDLIAGRQRLRHSRSDRYHVTGKLVAADKRIRP